MKYLIIIGNPKQQGLCHGVTEEVKKGAEAGGAAVEILNVRKLERCHVCGSGWATAGKNTSARLEMTALLKLKTRRVRLTRSA